MMSFADGLDDGFELGQELLNGIGLVDGSGILVGVVDGSSVLLGSSVSCTSVCRKTGSLILSASSVLHFSSS